MLPAELKELILEYLVISKTLGQLANGKKNWINLVRDGRIHGRVDPLGTVSHRCSHMDPNLAQVPSVSLDKDDKPIKGWKGGFGVECRSLFRPGVEGWVQTGTDASGLELRMLGHYLWKYDGGEFARRVSAPGLDIHEENAKITGLSRSATKTVTYAFLYGAGNIKLGTGVGLTQEEEDTLWDTKEVESYVKFMKKTFKDFEKPDNRTLSFWAKGKQVKDAFLSGVTGLKNLQKDLAEEARKYGFIIAIDGRKLYIRKPHAALNQLLQGGGAVVCKVWMKKIKDHLKEAGLVDGKDFTQMATCHDEAQYESPIEHQPILARCSYSAMKAAQHIVEFRGELDVDVKHGTSWMDTH